MRLVVAVRCLGGGRRNWRVFVGVQMRFQLRLRYRCACVKQDPVVSRVVWSTLLLHVSIQSWPWWINIQELESCLYTTNDAALVAPEP